MASDQHYRRVDLVEAKNLITKKIGDEKAEKYFNLLSRFFTKKLNRCDFEKLCIVAVGRENIAVHNLFIRSIVKNACLSKSPPAKPSKLVFSVNGEVMNGYQTSCYQSLYKNHGPKPPRKGRTPAFGRYRDIPSPLGKHGKPPLPPRRESAPKVLEQQSATEVNSLGSKPIEAITVENGEEVVPNAVSPGIDSRKTLTAPIGVQFRGNRTHSRSSVPTDTCYGNRELPDTFSLKTRLEQKFVAEGLNVSLEYANLLNASLNMHLKKLIEPCVELARSRFRNMQIMNGTYVQSPSNYTWSSPVDVQTAMELDTNLQQNWQAGTGTTRFGGHFGS